MCFINCIISLHLHPLITCLTGLRQPLLFIVPVLSQKSERSCSCVIDGAFASFYDFQKTFESVLFLV